MWFWLLVILAIIGWFVYKNYQDRHGLRKSKLNSARIIDEWFFLMEGGNGLGDKIQRTAEQKLKVLNVPNMKMEYKDISLGLFSRMQKGGRKFLVVENNYFRGYHAFLGTHDYGNQLCISWYLTLDQGSLVKMMTLAAQIPFLGLGLWPLIVIGKTFQKLVHRGRSQVIPENMDLFDKEELRAYATTVHGAAKEATQMAMKDSNLNFAKVDWHTRGLLNLS